MMGSLGELGGCGFVENDGKRSRTASASDQSLLSCKHFREIRVGREREDHTARRARRERPQFGGEVNHLRFAQRAKRFFTYGSASMRSTKYLKIVILRWQNADSGFLAT